MDRLDQAIRLIQAAQRELKYIRAMQAELNKLSIYDPDYYTKHQRISRKYGRTPNKTLVNSNLEKARRILLDECIKEK